jgi:hypothetical protein
MTKSDWGCEVRANEGCAHKLAQWAWRCESYAIVDASWEDRLLRSRLEASKLICDCLVSKISVKSAYGSSHCSSAAHPRSIPVSPSLSSFSKWAPNLQRNLTARRHHPPQPSSVGNARTRLHLHVASSHGILRTCVDATRVDIPLNRR